MKIKWTKTGKQDTSYLHKHKPLVYKNILILIEEIKVSPFVGRGKLEPLKYMRGLWSRRLTQEDRLVYQVSGKGPQLLEILSCL